MKVFFIGLLCSCIQAFGHMQPYVKFMLTFEDALFRPASGLCVQLETLDAIAESELKSGSAMITLPFPRDYTGPLRLRVFDRRRRPISLKDDSGHTSLSQEFHYAHKTGIRQKINPNFNDPFDDGIEFLSADRTIKNSINALKCFHLVWDSASRTADEIKESQSIEVMDQKIVAELKENLEAIRKQTLHSAKGK
jgi:hypothetical protein